MLGTQVTHRHLLALSHPILMENGEVQQPWSDKGMVTRGSEPSGMRLWVTLSGKPLSIAELSILGEGNVKWVVQEGEDEQFSDSYKGRELGWTNLPLLSFVMKQDQLECWRSCLPRRDLTI